MDKNTRISNKIKKLMSEGKGQSQAIAQAYSMYEDMMQKGGLYFEDGGDLPKYQGAGTFSQPFNFGQSGYDFSKVNNNVSTPGNEKFIQFPTTTYGAGIPELGSVDFSKKPNINLNMPGQIPQWNIPQNNTPIPTSPIITQPTKKSVTTPQVKKETDVVTTVSEQVQPTQKETATATDWDKDANGVPDLIQRPEEGENSLGFTVSGMDTAQRMEDTTKQSPINPNFNYQDPYQFFNPYGGVDIPTAANYLGQSIENKDTFGIVTGGLKTGLGVARNIFGGMGQANVRNEAVKKFKENQRDFMTGANTPQQMSSAEKGGTYPNFQDGGEQQIMEQEQAQMQAPPQEQGNTQDQLMQEVAQALQSGAQPEEVVQQLVQMGMSEEEAVQIIQMIMQQMQGGQPAPEEQMMKCGGKKMQDGGSYLETMKGKKIKNYTYNKDTDSYEVEFE